VSNLGYDPSQREIDVERIYCEGPDVAAELMDVYGATYVLSRAGILDCDTEQPTDFAASDRFETVYAVDGVSVWRLRSEASG
jgi:uncharacterized membrane protein